MHSHLTSYLLIMRPSSLGGGRILRRTLSVCLSVRPSVPLADVLCLQLHRLTGEHPKYKNFGFRLWASVTYVLFGTRRGPHIVRPSRPHKFLFYFAIYGGGNDTFSHVTATLISTTLNKECIFITTLLSTERLPGTLHKS